MRREKIDRSNLVILAKSLVSNRKANDCNNYLWRLFPHQNRVKAKDLQLKSGKQPRELEKTK